MIKRKVKRIAEDFVDPEFIFGDTTSTPSDKMPTTLKKTVKKKKKRPNAIPGVDVRVTDLPDTVTKLDPTKINNLINIPERTLLMIKRKSELQSDAYSTFLMAEIMPKLMAFSAGNSYVQTAMSDGMGIDIDIDQSVAEVLQNLMRLDVIVFFLRRMKMPLKYKRQFLSHMVEKITSSCIEKMDKVHKTRDREAFIKDLEGVVVRSYSKNVNKEIQDKVQMHSKRSAEKALQTQTQKVVKQDSGILSPRPAPMAKRRRSS